MDEAMVKNTLFQKNLRIEELENDAEKARDREDFYLELLEKALFLLTNAVPNEDLISMRVYTAHAEDLAEKIEEVDEWTEELIAEMSAEDQAEMAEYDAAVEAMEKAQAALIANDPYARVYGMNG